LLYSAAFNHKNITDPEQPETPGQQQQPVLTETGREPGYSFVHPTAAIRPDGAFTVLWEDRQGGKGGRVDLLMQGYVPAGGAIEPLYLAPALSQDRFGTTVSLISRLNGEFMLFWESGRTRDTTLIENIHFSREGKSLGQAGPLLESDYPVQRRPVSAVNCAGCYSIAWQEQNASGGYRIRAAHFDSTGLSQGVLTTVDESRVTERTGNYLSGVAIALGEDGTCYVAWERWKSRSSAPELMLARFDRETLSVAGSAKKLVAGSSSGGGRLAVVAAGPLGHHLVLWRQGAVGRDNARLVGRFYSPEGSAESDVVISDELRLGYLGSVGRPAVAASPGTGDFLVVWQEFFGAHQQLFYCRFDSTGNWLPFLESRFVIDGDGTGSEVIDSFYVRTLGESESGEDDAQLPAQTNPTVAADTLGNYLVLWAEKEPGEETSLQGCKLDSTGGRLGSNFTVPGVTMGALPAFGSLGEGRFAVAWQDTVGQDMRVLAQVFQIYTAKGMVLLSGTGGKSPRVFAHIEGNVTDSVPLGPAGDFTFGALVRGDYRFWLTAGGSRVPASLDGFSLGESGRPVIDLGTVADLTGSRTGPALLPRAAGLILDQNVPNPFNPSTTLSFYLGGDKSRQEVSLEVYNLRGGLVARLFTGELEGDRRHSFTWDGTDTRGHRLPSGIYLYRLKAGLKVAVRKMVLIK
ncbi:MAG: FlgD immunoglobulin-like domain containing protein, partial [Gemmatimonadota bacterium]|nr:FlgD immunoglobulin-like domain containing protein [Gemmatimonadota bacterium]